MTAKRLLPAGTEKATYLCAVLMTARPQRRVFEISYDHHQLQTTAAFADQIECVDQPLGFLCGLTLPA